MPSRRNPEYPTLDTLKLRKQIVDKLRLLSPKTHIPINRMIELSIEACLPSWEKIAEATKFQLETTLRKLPMPEEYM